ncbi:hypothetical protein I552_6769 [Mycobacterium xenopi 3993]|nr:hypothetical protein I552_6769 [Mycobacterium xenopi 3993]
MHSPPSASSKLTDSTVHSHGSSYDGHAKCGIIPLPAS